MLTRKQLKTIKYAVINNGYGVLVTAGGAAGSLWTFNTIIKAQAAAAAQGMDLFPGYTVQAASVFLGWSCLYATHLLYSGFAARLTPLTKNKDRTIVSYDLPDFPDTSKTLQFVVGETHYDNGVNLPVGSYSDSPEWASISANGLYTGTMIIGATGSAKTAGIIRPALSQLLEFGANDPSLKVGGLIMDYKASLVAPVVAVCNEAGRSDDLIIIGPKHNYRWNPIHSPELDPKTIAGRLLAVLENVSGQSNQGDQAWIASGVGNILEHAIGIIRTLDGYVTIADIHHFVTALDAVVSSSDTPAEAAKAMLDTMTSSFNPNSQEQAEQVEWHKTYFVTEFSNTDKRYRAIFMSEVSRITTYFADPQYKSRFSPAEADIDFLGFDDAIQNGKLVVLDCNADIYGILSTALAVVLKLSYQRAMLSRPVRAREDTTYNNTRPMCLIIDEAQEYVSTGDAQFLALSRESKAVVMFATQSRHSLVAKMGEDKTKVLLASLRSRIWLALSDAEDCELAAKHCGQQWGDVKSTNISESVVGAGMAQGGSLIGDATTVAQSQSFSSQKINIIEPLEFSTLPAFTGIASIFNGTTVLPPVRVLLKPYFKDRDYPFKDFAGEPK